MVRTSRSRRGGFTLVEVLLVLVILVIIGTIAATNLLSAGEQAKIRAAKAQIAAFQGPLDLYRMNMGDYPATGEGLMALIQPPPGDQGAWMGPYLSRDIPMDPWNRPYQYAYPGQYNPDKPDIWSVGRSGNETIGNWME